MKVEGREGEDGSVVPTAGNKGEEIWARKKCRKSGWTVLTREQVGTNWIISKKLARHEH